MAAPIRAIVEAESLRQSQRVRVHLPPGGAVDARRFLEDVGIAIARERHLPLGPREIRIGHAILPAHVVVAMDAGLVAGVAHGAHHIAGPSSDVRSGQQRAIEKRAHAVMLDDRRPLDFPHEAGAENALDRPSRVIGSERE